MPRCIVYDAELSGHAWYCSNCGTVFTYCGHNGYDRARIFSWLIWMNCPVCNIGWGALDDDSDFHLHRFVKWEKEYDIPDKAKIIMFVSE